MKQILTILVLFIFIGGASAGTDVYNITNIVGDPMPEICGGTNVITLHPHYVDHWFSLYNDGHVTYQVYAYDYVGIHDPPYKAAFIGAIETGQMGVLNNNASYYLYADYDDMSDWTDSEKIKAKFNSWWLLIFVGAIIIVILIVIYRRLEK